MFEFPVTAFLFHKDVTGILQILDQLANLAWHWRKPSILWVILLLKEDHGLSNVHRSAESKADEEKTRSQEVPQNGGRMARGK
jgi:hypothetical protein